MAVVGDALGVLHDGIQMRAKDAVLNELMGDIALISAPTGQSLQGAHVWSERNTVCEALSRMSESDTPPRSLLDTPRTTRIETSFNVVGSRE